MSWNTAATISSNKTNLEALWKHIGAKVICLQEIRKKQNFKLGRQFKTYYTAQDGESLSGGTLIAVENGIPSKELMIGMDKNITVVEIYIPKKITVITVYMQPGRWQETLDKLEETLQEIEGNVILTGDFNAKSTEWYERTTNPSGRKIMNLCDQFNMNIIDKNKPTHYNRRFRSSHHIDLTMVSANIAADFDWDTEEVRHGSDHFPIIITWNEEEHQEQKRKWKYENARWK